MIKGRFITSPKAKKQIITSNPSLMSVILLCDAPGYRMRSYGPTPLITIDNNKLIDLQINFIQQQFSKFEIIMCVGFDSDKISKYIRSKYSHINIRLVENQLFNNCNSCESVRVAINNTFNDKIVICDGSLLINANILSLVDKDHSAVIAETTPCSNLEIGINIDENNYVQHFSYGASNVWSEIIFLQNNDIIENFRKILSSSEYKNKFIFEALNELIKTKFKLKCYFNDNPIKKINNIKTYHSIKG